MKRFLLLPTCLLGLALVTTSALRSAFGTDARTVYTVAALREQLRRHPAALLDRTVRVRGVAHVAYAGCVDTVNSADCTARRFALFDATPTVDAAITLTPESPAPLRAALRHWPPLATLLPAPQQLVFGSPAVYRVLVRQAVCAGERAPCYEAALVDAEE